MEVLTGGDGVDTFVFDAPGLGTTTILDFAQGEDIIQIFASGFGGGLSSGSSAAVTSFADISLASSAGTDGYFVFDNSAANAGTLYWDATGGASGDAVPIAALTGVSSLTSSDFRFV